MAFRATPKRWRKVINQYMGVAERAIYFFQVVFWIKSQVEAVFFIVASARQWRFARSRCPQGFLGMERRGLGILWLLAENFIILLSEQWKITCCLVFFCGLLYYTVKWGLCNKWYYKDPVLKQPGFNGKYPAGFFDGSSGANSQFCLLF